MNPLSPLNRMSPTRRPASSGRVRGRGVLAIVLVSLWLACPADARDPFNVNGDDIRVRGNRQAPVTLLEYSDFTCGYCEKFFRETWPMLMSEYVENGTLRLVYRDFPRGSSGPTVDTAQAARCAGEQGRYWAMHDRLFTSRDKFSPAHLRRLADTVSLDAQAFRACFDEHRYTKDIFADRIDASTFFNIRGTPGFVLYLTETPLDSPIIIPGALPYATFKEGIDTLLTLASSPSQRPSGNVLESSLSD